MPTPRIILHGGAGPVTRKNLPPHEEEKHKLALLRILRSTRLLFDVDPDTDALTAACHAVSLLEEDPHFNAGRGAVFTRSGTNELEASVMVSSPHVMESSVPVNKRALRKRGAAVMGIKRVKSPIQLGKQVLLHSTEDVGDPHGGGARSHVQLHGEVVEELGRGWGVEMCDPSYYWTRARWEEHLRGLQREQEMKGADAAQLDQYWQKSKLQPDGVSAWPEVDDCDEEGGWDPDRYEPQGTVGCVVMDSSGYIAAATSTGGVTNKLAGRIGDTPTFGAGFWAEQWNEVGKTPHRLTKRFGQVPGLSGLVDALLENGKHLRKLPILDSIITTALKPVWIISRWLGSRSRVRLHDVEQEKNIRNKAASSPSKDQMHHRRGVGMSGTGTGDSFLQLAAVRTVASHLRWAHDNSSSRSSTSHLQDSITYMAGEDGELQKSAGDRWGETAEGQGGIIGIEFVDQQGRVAFDFNCGGMFRAWVDDEGKEHAAVFEE